MKFILELESTNNYFLVLREELNKAISTKDIEETEAYRIWGDDFAKNLKECEPGDVLKIHITDLENAALKFRNRLIPLLVKSGFLSSLGNKMGKFDKQLLLLILSNLSIYGIESFDPDDFMHLANIAGLKVIDSRPTIKQVR